MKTAFAFVLLIASVAAQEYPVGVVPGSPEDLAARKPAFRSSLTDLTRIGCKLRPDLGSGVNTEYGVITCWHCVSSGKPIEVECDGEIGRGTVIAKDEAADVALIAVPWTRWHPTVEVATDRIPYAALSLIARSAEGSLSVTPAMASGSRLFDGLETVTPPTIAGQSGGGYIDASGKLAGIVSGNIVDREPFRGLMIPASAIRKILPKSANLHTAAASPTPMAEIDRVLELLPKPQKKFVELGCGSDARWCIAVASKWMVPCIGIEIDPVRAKLAQERVKAEGFADLITIYQGDATAYDYSSADVGACYLYQDTIVKLLPKIRQMRAFASYLHEPVGLGATRNGDSWIYIRSSMQSVPMVNYGGQLYAGRVCSDPRCGMCAAIQAGLAQSQQQPATPRGQHVETRRVKVCNGKSCWWEDRQVLVND